MLAGGGVPMVFTYLFGPFYGLSVWLLVFAGSSMKYTGIFLCRPLTTKCQFGFFSQLNSQDHEVESEHFMQ